MDTEPKLIQSRRAAREAALKALYQIEVGGFEPLDVLLDVLAEEPFEVHTAAFISELVGGTSARRREIDARIAPLLAPGWTLDRLATTDRAVLRLACYELFEMPGIPPKVTIDQAISLAKRYGTEESGRFVNGLLGRLLEESPKAQWDPAQAATHEPEPEPEPEIEIEDEGEVREGTEEHDALLFKSTWRTKVKEDV